MAKEINLIGVEPIFSTRNKLKKYKPFNYLATDPS
jgi:hypothetical protein